jgi:ParB family transcriptional regulator, chromosome partitioning protein
LSEKKPALGRGLADLLGASKARAATPAATVPIAPPAGAGAATAGSAASNATTAATTASPNSAIGPRGDELAHLPVTQLTRGKYQPRADMRQEALEELAISIRNQGVIQPIVVRPLANAAAGAPQYEIIAGERRWRAAQIAGLTTIPAVIRRVPDEAAIAMALIENIQREDLNPLEEAQALQRLIDEFDLTHAQAAEAVGRSRAAVSNLLRLLELPPDIRTLVETRALEMGHARALLSLAPQAAVALARQAADNGWSVREVEHRVQQLAAGQVPDANRGKSNKPAKAKPQADLVALERELSESLGTVVNVLHGRGSKGRLVIHYTDLDTLDGILERLKTRN